MADQDPAFPPESAPEDPAPVVLPPRAAFPPPPDVTYTRPHMPGQPRVSADGSHRSAQSQGGGGQDTGTSGHGAGIAAGTTFVVSIIAGAVAGNFIDQRWDHTGMPWATIAMILLGTAAGFVNMQRILNRSNRNNKP